MAIPLRLLGRGAAWIPSTASLPRVPCSSPRTPSRPPPAAPQAGLQAAYVQREGWDPYPAFLPRQPQLVVPDFAQLAARLAQG